MKINWKVRFKNAVWLASFIGVILSFVYTILEMFDIVPTISKNTLVQAAKQVLTFLTLIGVIQDPTTNGLGDSQRALSYEEPWKDPVEDEESDE
jgi:phi LC3 family holin